MFRLAPAFFLLLAAGSAFAQPAPAQSPSNPPDESGLWGQSEPAEDPAPAPTPAPTPVPAPAPAPARTPTPAPPRPYRLWLEATAFAGTVDGVKLLVASPRLSGTFDIRDTFRLRVDVPMVFANVDLPSGLESRNAPGNPYLGLSYLERRAERLTVHAGLGIAVPIANNAEDDPYDNAAFLAARAAAGLVDAWLFTQDRFSAVLHAGGYGKVRRGPVLRGDAHIAMMPRVRGQGDPFHSLAQLRLSVAGQLSQSTQMGARLTAVVVSLQRVEGGPHVGLAPFLNVETRGGTLFDLALNMNLSQPFGFAFTDGVWGVRLLAGSAF